MSVSSAKNVAMNGRPWTVKFGKKQGVELTKEYAEPRNAWLGHPLPLA